jgi:hypothetical protein
MESGKDGSSQDLVLRVGRVQSACIVVSWALDLVAETEMIQENKAKRFEVIDGLGLIMELVSRELGTIYGELNGE